MKGKRSSPAPSPSECTDTTIVHKWAFRARFRRGAFGWRSQPAVTRVKEAVAEIKKAARIDPLLGAEGAVLLLEKLSPALEHVDSSSGAIGTAVNNAIKAFVPIIAGAAADDCLRESWLERLWQAVEEDEMPSSSRLLGGALRDPGVRLALGRSIYRHGAPGLEPEPGDAQLF